jgi:thioredoxin-like negative regulator of GroEL
MCKFIFVAAVLWLCAATVVADELLIFSADWCPSCQQLKAAIKQDPTLVAGYEVVIIDFDKNPDLVKGYKIRSIPAILHLQPDGKIRRKVGFKNAAEFKRWLAGKYEQPTKLRKFMRYRLY